MAELMGAVPSTAVQDRAEACGSPGEVRNDPSLAHRYGIFTPGGSENDDGTSVMDFSMNVCGGIIGPCKAALYRIATHTRGAQSVCQRCESAKQVRAFTLSMSSSAPAAASAPARPAMER